MFGIKTSSLLAITLAGSCGVATIPAQADIVDTGNVFYAYDFEDGTVGNAPVSSTGEVSWSRIWTSEGTDVFTEVGIDPANAANQALRSDTDSLLGAGTGPRTTGAVAHFSGTMTSHAPRAGTLGFRLYLDQNGSFSSAIRVLIDSTSVPTNNSNTVFAISTESAKDRLLFTGSTDGPFVTLHTGLDDILDQWVNITVQYDLDAATDTFIVSLDGAGINTTLNIDDSNASAVTSISGFSHANRGNGAVDGLGDAVVGDDTIVLIDDIQWTVVPEPGSTSLLVTGAVLMALGRLRRH